MVRRNTGANAIMERIAAKEDEYERRFETGTARPNVEAEGSAPDVGCAVRQLPSRLQFRAAEVAARLNPVNAPVVGLSAAVDGSIFPTPLAAAVVTSKYWGPNPRKLTVSFMDNPPTDLRRRIISHLNAWTKTGCIEFVETNGTGQVRIARGSSGYWSYLGTDVLLIPQNRPTMNLQGFTMNTSDSEYRRVVRHEAGHTLGMPHEHMRSALVARIDREKAYEYFRRTQGWDRATVDQQVLTPLDEATLMFTPADQDSIMCYQLPGSITHDGQPIRGGTDINATDYAFVARVYPKPAKTVDTRVEDDGWPEADDVEEIAV
jgi:hypothetical protein